MPLEPQYPYRVRYHPLSTVLTGLTSNAVTAQDTRHANSDLSVHYLISREGHVIKMVDEHYTAFHGSPGIWEGKRFINFRAVGIELLNSGSQDFTDIQMRALRRLLEWLTTTFDVKRRRVLGHGEVNHARNPLTIDKDAVVVGAELHPTDRLLSCPGRRFPWPSFSDVAPKLTFDRVPGLQSSTAGGAAPPAQIQRLKRKLGELGYPVSSDNRPLSDLDGTFDEATQRAYAVFQLRWHESRSDRPSQASAQAPNQATVDAVVAAIDAILAAPL
ncbi:MAG: N-acetylmuramoyl-L-alanine amidase [Myxococcales bacterium]|nr:N-acetylmuramoyl-L-alanine amidase [Myxococcales bacterium]